MVASVDVASGPKAARTNPVKVSLINELCSPHN
jgi:hypothetical protein